MHSDTLPATPTAVLLSEGFAALCTELPEFPVGTTADDIAALRHSAMDAVRALNPTNAFEVRLAVRIVAADAHAADCLAAASPTGDPEKRRSSRAQAASMARQSDAALRALLRIQATREKQDATMHPAAMARGGYWFRDASAPAPDRVPPHAATAPEPANPDIEAEASGYATLHPDRVARGGIPPGVDFGPPDPVVVSALLRAAPERMSMYRRSRQRDIAEMSRAASMAPPSAADGDGDGKADDRGTTAGKSGEGWNPLPLRAQQSDPGGSVRDCPVAYVPRNDMTETAMRWPTGRAPDWPAAPASGD